MLSESSDLMEVEDYHIAVYESLWSFRKREKRIALLNIERNNNELNSIVLSCVSHQFMKKVNLLSIRLITFIFNSVQLSTVFTI